jgi:hypothetical protein
MYKFKENKEFKIVSSSDYNYVFNKLNGQFARWGKTKEDDPQQAPAPEILDLEISSGGDCLGMCPFCYKGNGGTQETFNMTFEDFKIIFDKMPKFLTQIAFGIMNIGTNPDFFKMMEYSREHGVIPNYTCHGLDVTKEYAERTSKLCGAVAVSIINKEKTFESIKMFADEGMTQVNIHYMVSKERYDEAFKLIDEIAKRKIPVNAVVFLQYKSKGRGTDKFSPVCSVEDYKKLIEHATNADVRIGFDSCSCPLWYKTIEGTIEEKKSVMGEPCEAACMSSYINCKGEFYPCSFTEGTTGWENGIDVFSATDFIKDIWNHPRVKDWRIRLLGTTNNCNCKFKKICRKCPIYDITDCKNIKDK